MSLFNFATIQYALMIDRVPWLRDMVPGFREFVAVFAVVYIPTAVLIGWNDYKRFAVKKDLEIVSAANPFNQDLARAISSPEKAKEILAKWIPDSTRNL